MKRKLQALTAALVVAALSQVSTAFALEKVNIGLFGAWSAASWPALIADKKGFYAEQNIQPDFVFAPSASTLVQQLIVNALDVVGASGIAEPILAADKGAPVSVLRLIGTVPNYSLMAKPGIAKIEDLKGKKVSIGGLTDINRVQLDRMINPHGVKVSDLDIIVIGSGGPRLAALQAGAVDATMLVPPQSFAADAMGFRRLGELLEYAPDMPQTCMQVYTPWAQKNPQLVKGLIVAMNKSIAWFYDPKNRDEAIDLMTAALKTNRNEVANSYDYLVKIQHFARSDAIERLPFESLIKDMRNLKFIQSDVKLEQVIFAGVKIE